MVISKYCMCFILYINFCTILKSANSSGDTVKHYKCLRIIYHETWGGGGGEEVVPKAQSLLLAAKHRQRVPK